MTQTVDQRRDVARRLARQMFPEGVTANLNLDDLVAVIASIDSGMGRVIGPIPGSWQGKAVGQALIDDLPEPFQSRSTPVQKAQAVAFWAMKEAGAI